MPDQQNKLEQLMAAYRVASVGQGIADREYDLQGAAEKIFRATCLSAAQPSAAQKQLNLGE